MKKAILLTLHAVLLIGMLGGATVSLDSAAEVGQKWLRHAYPARMAIQIERQQPVLRDGQTLFYIFELNGGGWVLVAANDACEPILAYCDSGSFEYPVSSPEARYWITTFEDQLLEAIRRSADNSAKLPLWNEIRAGDFARWSGTRDVSPLLTTTWNQDQYYNASCPVDLTGPPQAGGHAYAGCVATAMGQVMKKWNHPAQGTISHSYVENTYGTLSANFGATTYNWSAMPNNLTTHNTAVATLLYHCGVGVDMDYGPTASSANVFTNDAMEVFFGYDPAAQWQWRSGYSDTDWMNLMKADLNAGRPIVYVGYNSSYTTGHTFVMDGFSSGNYFHFNWGWSGLYNGNFLLNSLIPLTGWDFSYFQWAYYNLYPGVTVSGTVTDSSSLPLASVSISFSGAGTATTDANGVYSIAVPNGYSGTATPFLTGYNFTPASRSYASITSNQTAQNYIGTSAVPPPINLTTTGITQVSCTISWTEVGSAMAWDFEIGPAGFTPGMGMGYLQTMVGQPYLVWGLLPGTPYDWYVRSNYWTYTSAWSLPASFITLGSPPLPPSNLTTTGVTNTSATFSWLENGSATMWDIEYGPPGFVPGFGAGTLLTYVANNPYAYVGLFPGTPYDWYVRSFYGIFATGWSLAASFTTVNTPVTPPANLTTTGITNTGATLNWTETGNAFMWDVEYGPPGLTPGIGMGILLVGVGMPIPPNGGQFPIGGLMPGTPYRWFV
ncbi:MAG TPA: C10 family peptidase, partial [Candidatus Syntrophosphaera sp.]|nr:C10 family peptidase [Candidatus Syntrophosphaera sp.]